MEVYQDQCAKSHARAACDEDKQRWVEEHALRMGHLFEQWQKPLGIDGEQYRKYLIEELDGYCDKPLLKSLIESISLP
jgi:hypothetical protein